jgi:hypothetical protein
MVLAKVREKADLYWFWVRTEPELEMGEGGGGVRGPAW